MKKKLTELRKDVKGYIIRGDTPRAKKAYQMYQDNGGKFTFNRIYGETKLTISEFVNRTNRSIKKYKKIVK